MHHPNCPEREHSPFQLEAGPERALLIHGFLGSPRDMRPLAEALAAAGVSARALLLPGFGADRSGLWHVRASDWLNVAREAWEETRRGAPRATLIGFSMGGAIALRLGAEQALVPDELILLAPHWRFAARRAVILPIARHVIRTYRPFGRPDFSDPDTRLMLSGMAPGADLDDPAVQHQLRDAMSVPTRSLDELRRVGNAAGAAARRVAATTTILQGAQDGTTLPRHSRTLAARVGAELLEFPGDHLLVDPNRPTWSTVRDAVVYRALGRPR